MIEYGWLALQWLLIISGLFCTAIGLITVVQWLRTPNDPNDDSNRINNIASWWIGLTRPEVLGNAYHMFQQDVMDNIDDIEYANAPLPSYIPEDRRVEHKKRKTRQKKKKK